MKSVVVLLCFSGVAAAQQRSEDSPAMCSDHVDNDRNGLVDCDDPKCNGMGRCRLSLVDPEMDAPMTGRSQMTAGVLMLVAGPAIAAASSAVFLDALHQNGESRRTVEFVMGGVMGAAGLAIGITGATFLRKGWRRHKEDIEMGLALGPTKLQLRVTF